MNAFIQCALAWVMWIGFVSPGAAANTFLHGPRPTASGPQADSLEPASDTSQDYSHALALSVSGKQGVVRFRLPQDVYLHARSASLDDLRVFDSAGAKVPFALHLPPAPRHVERLSLPVKIFPLNVDASQQRMAAGDAIDLEIKTAADGTLLSLKTKSGRAPRAAANPVLAGLIVDTRQPDDKEDSSSRRHFDALRFSLPETTTTYSAQVWLETSDDLKHWNTIGVAELSWLTNGDGQRLANDRLEFPQRSFRYARLTWRRGEALLFSAIGAESTTQKIEPPFMEQLILQPQAGKEAQDLAYRAALAIPVEKVGLQFAEANVVLPLSLGSYRELPSRQVGQATRWSFQPLTRATFYQITQSGEARRSADVSLPPTHLAEWVLRPQTQTISRPTLRIGWQPATLVFLASGTGPYTLAFGRDKVKSAALELSQVSPGFSTEELTALEQAIAGPMQARPMHVEESAAASAATTAQQRMWILWGVLLLGVGAVGVLAWRLFRQMK